MIEDIPNNIWQYLNNGWVLAGLVLVVFAGILKLLPTKDLPPQAVDQLIRYVVKLLYKLSLICLVGGFVLLLIGILQGLPGQIPPGNKIDFSGKYIYRSVPKYNVKLADQGFKQALIVDEDAKDYYQFVGTAEITVIGNTEAIQICGRRQFQVSLDTDRNVSITEVDVGWHVSPVSAFMPQRGEAQTIFILETDNPKGVLKNKNMAIYIGKVTQEDIDGNRRIKRINGHMYYLNIHEYQGQDKENKTNPTWTHAEMELVRVDKFDEFHLFIDEEKISKWFKDVFKEEINTVNLPRSIKSRPPKSNCGML